MLNISISVIYGFVAILGAVGSVRFIVLVIPHCRANQTAGMAHSIHLLFFRHLLGGPEPPHEALLLLTASAASQDSVNYSVFANLY